MQKKQVILESKIETLKKKDTKTEKRIRQTIKKHKIEQEELVKKQKKQNKKEVSLPKKHEIISAEIMSQDENLHKFFSDEELKIIKEAIEDHRASAKDDPRSIYGRIVSSADRNNTVESCLKRTYTYGKKLNPKATDMELYNRAYDVLVNKFGEDGYAKFYFKDSKYEAFLKEIRALLKDKEKFINTQKSYIEKLKESKEIS